MGSQKKSSPCYSWWGGIICGESMFDPISYPQQMYLYQISVEHRLLLFKECKLFYNQKFSYSHIHIFRRIYVTQKISLVFYAHFCKLYLYVFISLFNKSYWIYSSFISSIYLLISKGKHIENDIQRQKRKRENFFSVSHNYLQKSK